MTTAQEIEKLLNDYRAWLKEKTTLREINSEWVEITTPYLDRHNDALQIYARYRQGLTNDPRFAGLIAIVHAYNDLAQRALEGQRISRLFS